ncbi:Ig-like domain-containing protein [Streptococcus mutans]|uniref:Ig-like domain-containing protein n=1 Tax=Streptococcus mutans TaxID=1309 RepID=UPI0004630B70|nr:Ig-like domain-containing protein [Streptococcus mutans]AVM72370.1 hypothetical protein CO204_10105 [Streptococcus mutans]MCB4936359.1 Ig-like domain-containing protein [Streptococcus mutans]MCB4988493.1 Ig-like domain-containing protein [Streptococcus mutans]MCB5154195.1 Ig-like domain-containing protein [Streptococcus mutans]NLQ36566.1 hypothetical protein [Streptococcus mutans]
MRKRGLAGFIASFFLALTFTLDETVKKDDTTTTLSDKLAFSGVKNFEIKDKNGYTVAMPMLILIVQRRNLR